MSDPRAGKLTVEKEQSLPVNGRLGKICVLAVGVSEYSKSSGFAFLKPCDNDALQVFTAFRDVRQLNGDESRMVLMTSGTTSLLPVRGSIMNQIHELSATAKEEDRLLFYFSGHGHRLDGIADHFLVPQDAYSESDPDAYLSLKKILQVLARSEARQKIVVLDCCVSGPEDELLGKLLAEAKGISVISSSAPDEASYARSDNPKLSLFTFYFIKALRGDPEALKEQTLLVPQLFDYVSTRVKKKSPDHQIEQTLAPGSGVLADFRQTLVVSTRIDLSTHPFSALLFREARGEKTKAILTEWENRSLTPRQLEYAANDKSAMGAFVQNDFSKWRPLLRKRFGFTPTDVSASGGTMTFPGGTLTNRFEARNKDSGFFHRELSLDVDWFNDGERLNSLLGLLNFNPDAFELQMNLRLNPMDQIVGLEGNDWEVQEESDDKVVAFKSGITMTITESALHFEGFDIGRLLAGGSEMTSDQRLLAETIDVIAPTKAGS